MLSYSLSRSHAGVTLIGDYTSLQWIHETVHAVNERSVLVKDKEGGFLALAYDVRKAYEGQREVVRPPAHLPELGVRYGVRMLWPTVLLQTRTLRASLAFLDSSCRDQAVCYALESVVEEAIQEDFCAGAHEILAQWRRIDPADPRVFDRLHSRGAMFCSWTRAERKRHFPDLLASFDPLYETLHRMRVRQGEKGLLDLSAFDDWEGREWPDPRW